MMKVVTRHQTGHHIEITTATQAAQARETHSEYHKILDMAYNSSTICPTVPNSPRVLGGQIGNTRHTKLAAYRHTRKRDRRLKKKHIAEDSP